MLTFTTIMLKFDNLKVAFEDKSDKDLKYLGFKPDIWGVKHHYYKIANHEVSVDMIEDLEQVEDETS